MFKRPIITTAAIVTALLASNPAEACDTIDNHVSAVFGSPPAASVGAEFVGKVVVRQKTIWLRVLDNSRGFYGRVLESSTHPDLVGKNIEIPTTMITSCGPYLNAGDKGYIFGKTDPSATAALKVWPVSLSWHQQLRVIPSEK